MWDLYSPLNITTYMQSLDQVCFPLHETCILEVPGTLLLVFEESRNMPITDIRKWNVIDAIWRDGTAYQEHMFISNCFTKGDFGTEKFVNEEEEDVTDWRTTRESGMLKWISILIILNYLQMIIFNGISPLPVSAK